MSGSKPALTSLEARKQLLLLESEMNRVQLRSDCTSLRIETVHLWERGHTLVTTASLVFTGFKTLPSLWNGETRARGQEQKGIWPALLKLVKTGAALWMKRGYRD